MDELVLIETNSDFEDLTQILNKMSEEKIFVLDLDFKRNNEGNPSKMVPFIMCR